MEYTEKMLSLEKKIIANYEKLQAAKEKVSLLETERQKLELSKKELLLKDYLPIIEALSISPAELKELLADYLKTDKKEVQ